MTTISKEAVEEFQLIWKREYGKSLSNDLAHIYANKLLNLFLSIYRKIPNPDKTNLEDKKR